MSYNRGMASFTRCRYTKKEFLQAIRKSLSIAEALRNLNLAPVGGNYATVHRKIKELNLDTSHMTGRGWNTGGRFRVVRPAEPLTQILVENRFFSICHLKRRLIKEGLKEYKCESCMRTEWRDKPIALELEHIDGRRDNNRLENLRLLCPNCHAQTPTYRGKNKGGNAGIGRQHSLKRSGAEACVGSSPTCRTNKCKDCDKPISNRSTRCKSCAGKHTQKTKIVWPPLKKLIREIQTTSYLQVSKRLGVSDNAVRKHIQRRSPT